MVEGPEKTMEQVILEDGRYPPEAFGFLHEGLTRAVENVHAGQDPKAGQRHVSGRQLCDALAELAVDKWGMLAQTVLNHWNIHATLDFGNMVYLLVENEFMRKTEEDSLEDFRDVYDFDRRLRWTGKFELKE
jgi:uncharacterized repeat protein (TIGR04138 family)